MKQYKLMTQEPNKPMPTIYYILARSLEEARQAWYINIKHPGWFIYSIEEIV